MDSAAPAGERGQPVAGLTPARRLPTPALDGPEGFAPGPAHSRLANR